MTAVAVRTQGHNAGGRPDLVPYLKLLTLEQLSYYCTLVLSRDAGIPLEVQHRRCARPGCPRVIDGDAPGNKLFCSSACGSRDRYHRRLTAVA